MFETYSDIIKVAISMLIAAFILRGINVAYTLSNKFQEKQLEQQIIADELREQRNNLFYNNTHVYQQDIVSLILRYKGDRVVMVELNNGQTYEWSVSRKSSEYKVSEISKLLPKDVLYDADLYYGPNVIDVIGYTFHEHQAGCGRP